MEDNDQELLNQIFNNDKKALTLFYNEYAAEVERLIKSLGGNEHDAQDVFQEAIIVLYELRKQNKLFFMGSLKAFFCGIAKNIQLNDNRRKKLHGKFLRYNEDYKLASVDMDAIFDKAEKYRIFYKHFNRLSPICKELLREDAEKNTHAKMAIRLGYTANYSRVKKNSCKRTLCENVLRDPKYNELITG